MENKINIAKILSNCPSGMELDCTMYEDVCFDYVDELNLIHCYIQRETHKTPLTFNQHGTPNSDIKSKCVIFPIGKTTWEGFIPPYEFNDGDVVVAEDDKSFQLFLLNHLTHSEDDNGYDGYCYFGWDFQRNELFEKGKWGFNRLATEEEKSKLFQAIKDNGYVWNPETKTLEKLPKFKVGYRIQWNGNTEIKTVIAIEENRYRLNNGRHVKFGDEHCYKVLKFDISTLKPFESRVLVRSDKSAIWKPAIYGIYKDSSYWMVGGSAWLQCIPYEGNEHLFGTTNDCDNYYKNWEE